MPSPDPKNPNPENPASGDSEAPQQAVVKFAKDLPLNTSVMPTMLGVGYGTYQQRPENFLLSFVTHTAGLGLMFWLLHLTVPAKIIPPTTANSVELAPYIPMKVGKGGPSGGGGGDASKLKASAGTPPKAAKQQFTPPTVLPQQKSKLMMEPTVVADLKVPQNVQLGDPLSKLMTPSNGVGVGGGIGSGSGGGVGSGHGGPGVGPGIFHVGEGVSAPRAIYTPEPEFSEEARKAKYQGVVVLNIIVGTDGRVHSPRVVRSLGMGLDEKAIEGVKTWKFDPSKKDGRNVAVEMNIEVAFNLY
ncbi:MAG TPA: energy transducer TonB [Candidatus Polarisedimenticolia bacterium]|jgi:protein TonB|nr:energy transducer TonB [Candidatus Polarisedimenticolia bacterium]